MPALKILFCIAKHYKKLTVEISVQCDGDIWLEKHNKIFEAAIMDFQIYVLQYRYECILSFVR